MTGEARAAEELERLGRAAHELRDSLNTAILAFHTLKRGAVAINGSTGAILGRSLMSLHELVDRMLSECPPGSVEHQACAAAGRRAHRRDRRDRDAALGIPQRSLRWSPSTRACGSTPLAPAVT
jgi:hypothetical protein